MREGKNMYVEITYDGRIRSKYSSGGRRVTDKVELNGSTELVVKVDGGSSVTYYDNSYYDTASRGKIKSIGNTQIKYYDDGCYPFCMGKVRYIGDVEVYYYNEENGPACKGKIKYIDDVLVDYYGSEFPSYKAGKPKEIGNIKITIL